MALEGSLRDFDLFSLLNMIKSQGKNGTLVLSRSQELVKIFFEEGEIIGCDSNQVRMEDRVGAMLVRLGRLSGDELMAMIQKQRQTLKRMGTLLLESGKVSPQDLQDALFNQAMAIIYRTFRWVEGNYRFDSIVPLDLDRENFPAIPVDTVLMEAARITDEWPDVQRRLPDDKTPLRKTEYGAGLQLDLNKDLSQIFDGGSMSTEGSGLTHEQETVLTYFGTSVSIQNVLMVSRYDELETCKLIADLLEMGILEVSTEAEEHRPSQWSITSGKHRANAPPTRPSILFWPAVALFIGLPAVFHILDFPLPQAWPALNQGLSSLERADLHVAGDPATRTRQSWAFRMASPVDGGSALARTLSCNLDPRAKVPDLTAYPNPLVPTPRDKPPETPAAP